ncbi:MAG: bile acid:sodium symporter [Hyphomicrobium sp.]|uniref:bile acid:sodium symporter family protein n=1 Tax=Hyphomicrobium sp. TaxID=82 RepID=UPI0039E44517
MLQFLADQAIPVCVFFLMLVAGTEISRADFSRLSQNTRVVLLGSAGQLLALPPIALAIIAVSSPPSTIAAGLIILSLSPNGGISNSYCYLARCNVLLSATITAVGTALCLVTIPAWLTLIPSARDFNVVLLEVPSRTVVTQLLVLMILPIGIGGLVRREYPKWTASATKALRWLSIGFVAIILASAVATVGANLSELMLSIVMTAALFIIAAMTVGWLFGRGLNDRDRPVLAIEAGVRNVGVALLLGRTVVAPETFGALASFITGYFIVEVVIMLPYAHCQARRSSVETAKFPNSN